MVLVKSIAVQEECFYGYTGVFPCICFCIFEMHTGFNARGACPFLNKALYTFMFQ